MSSSCPGPPFVTAAKDSWGMHRAASSQATSGALRALAPLPTVSLMLTLVCPAGRVASTPSLVGASSLEEKDPRLDLSPEEDAVEEGVSFPAAP